MKSSSLMKSRERLKILKNKSSTNLTYKSNQASSQRPYVGCVSRTSLRTVSDTCATTAVCAVVHAVGAK